MAPKNIIMQTSTQIIMFLALVHFWLIVRFVAKSTTTYSGFYNIKWFLLVVLVPYLGYFYTVNKAKAYVGQ